MAAGIEIVGLFSWELWWRDRYHVLERRGHKLRPRYHPDWVPSWKKSGKGFLTAEDGQYSVVSVVHLISSMHNLAQDGYSNGRDAQGRNAGDAQEGRCERRTVGIEDRPNVLFARTQGRSP